MRTRDGTSLAATVWRGPRVRRTVVFLHGLCLNHHTWAYQTRRIAEQFSDDTAVIAYDHRGHGESSCADVETYRIRHLAEDLDDVLAALDAAGPIVLVGHSLGGMVALTYLTQPGGADVAGLVLCASAAGSMTAHGAGRLLAIPAVGSLTCMLGRSPLGAGRALAAPLRAAAEQLRAHGGEQQRALMGVVAHALATTTLRTAVGYLPSIRDFDVREHLGGITAGVTILSGGLDVLTPQALSIHMAHAIPAAVHHHFPRAGHMLPQLEAAAVSEAIAASVREAGMVRAGHAPADERTQRCC